MTTEQETANTVSVFRMVMPDRTCPYGLKTIDLLEREGFEIEDRHLTTTPVIGVDISRNMLAIGRGRIAKHDWKNIELIEADVADYDPPATMRAAISTFGLDITPEAERIVARFAEKMPAGARLGLLGFRERDYWPDWLVRFGIWLNSPCDIERKHLSIRPDQEAAKTLTRERRRNFWFGILSWSVFRKEEGARIPSSTGNSAL
jgi:SAM-dependent methyltransferase